MFVQNVVRKRFRVVLLSPSGTEIKKVVNAESEASAYLALPDDLRGPGWSVKEILAVETPRA